MPDFGRNNLAAALSPYLRQHADNPVHWQEWNDQTLSHAKETGKPLFVSIGYATCHWCHVMAREAFSDSGVAAVLNEFFVPVKVDREERPDIDQYCMAYLVQTTGSGGWPLNLVMTPDKHPIFAGTYFSVNAERGQAGFAQILRQLIEWYREHKDAVIPFQLPHEEVHQVADHQILSSMRRGFDAQHGGFGRDAKFPPHATLLFVLSLIADAHDEELEKLARKTLDAMALRGLQDHLQGGFFRYCTDRAWTIPHFEKMLYDQALLLWVYSAAARVLGDASSVAIADGVVRCLEETFREGDLYVSAHDADTNHEEGATYVWTIDELTAALSKEEMKKLKRVYDIDDAGNFEGKIHLIKQASEALPAIEKKLLELRRMRAQPFVDRKIVTSWNALLGVGFVHHWRATGRQQSLEAAQRIWRALRSQHEQGGVLVHASLEGKPTNQHFLEDAAAMLLLTTYLYEEIWSTDYASAIAHYEKAVEKFRRDNQWWENDDSGDFASVPARSFDNPVPSGLSLANEALFRAHVLLGQERGPASDYRYPLESDFWNRSALFQSGRVHEVHAPVRPAWSDLPFNAMLLKGPEYQDCFAQQCRRFTSVQQMKNAWLQ